jgi:hypothetical protein
MAIARFVAELGELEAVEKKKPAARLVAITHGDPRDEKACGRPVTYRATRVVEKRSADLVAQCALHGDLTEVAHDGNGYVGAVAFFQEDARARRRSE